MKSIKKDELNDSKFELKLIKRKRYPFDCLASYEFVVNENGLRAALIDQGNIYIYLKEENTKYLWFRKESFFDSMTDAALVVLFPISYSFGYYPICRKNLLIDYLTKSKPPNTFPYSEE